MSSSFEFYPHQSKGPVDIYRQLEESLTFKEEDEKEDDDDNNSSNSDQPRRRRRSPPPQRRPPKSNLCDLYKKMKTTVRTSEQKDLVREARRWMEYELWEAQRMGPVAKNRYMDKWERDLRRKCQATFVGPRNGIEFLRRSRKEALKMERIRRAPNADQLLRLRDRLKLKPNRVFLESSNDDDNNKSYNKNSRSMVSDPAFNFAKGQEWEEEVLGEMAKVRSSMEGKMWMVKVNAKKEMMMKFPKKEDERGWCLFCYGQATWDLIVRSRNTKVGVRWTDQDMTKKDEEELSGLAPGGGRPPTVAILLQIKSNVVSRLFKFHADWVESLERVPQEFGPWIYALMSRLEKPLYPDVGSALRTLALVCGGQRLRVARGYFLGESSDDGSDGSELEVVHSLTKIVCLVARFFDQSDLADREERMKGWMNTRV